MKVHGGMERWPHDHKGMKHEVKIMVIDEEQSCQGKGIVIPDFKDKTRYAPYVSFRSQISHILTNKG